MSRLHRKLDSLAVAAFCLLILAAANSFSQQNDFPKLTGPYLGQTPPGKAAEPFAPEFFGSRFKSYHSGIAFSPDGKEAYWQGKLNDERGYQAIFESKLENGLWTEPRVAPFSIAQKRGMDDSPFASPDGQRLFFISSRPTEAGGKRGNENIWVVDRTEEGWSEPRLIPVTLNPSEGRIHWSFSVDGQGALYFGAWKTQGEEVTGDIYVAYYEDGEYRQPEKLGPAINREGHYNFCPHIVPDGRYVVFVRVGAKKTERSPDNLYCSFRKRDGTWTEAKRLAIAGEKGNDVPVVSSDGKYLFLRHDIDEFYWVDAKIIEELKPDDLN